MRKFYALFAIVSVLGCSATAPVTPTLPSLKEKKVLIVWGGWNGHQPDKYAFLMEKWLKEEGAQVFVSNSLEIYSDSSFMQSLDLILPYWTMGTLSKEQSKGLLNAVKNGVGIAGCHGGFGDSFRSNTDYQYMVGGQFVSHPGGDSTAYTINMTDTNDQITEGVSDFEILSEQYYMLVDPNVRVLATTTFDGNHDAWIEGAIIPVAWKKNYDKGRVFYCSVGHNPATFEVPEVWTILTRGIKWASGSKGGELTTLVSPVYHK